MRSSLIRIVSFVFAIILLSFNVSAEKYSVNYKIEIGGINIGELLWVLEKTNRSYKTFVQLNDKGVFSLLYKFSGNYSAEGTISENLFISSNYNQAWKTKKKKREVKILFNNGFVSSLKLNPKETEVSRINYLDIKNLSDPLTSFLNIIANESSKFKTLDGRRLYRMSVDKKNSNKEEVTKIIIKEYVNLWADHNRSDLKSIEIKKEPLNKEGFFPYQIKIMHKGMVFKLIQN